MAKLVISIDEDQTEEFDLKDGSSIAEACESAGVPFACTEGVCGTCIIQVIDGHENLSELSDAEKDFLGDDENSSERLACQCCIQKNCAKITF